MEAESFWQKVSDSELMQGDYIFDCPVPIFAEIPAEKVKTSPKVKIYNLIVVTQSCDLANKKAPFVALCPIYTVAEFEEEIRKPRKKDFGNKSAKLKLKVYIWFHHLKILKTTVNVWSLIFGKYTVCRLIF